METYHFVGHYKSAGQKPGYYNPFRYEKIGDEWIARVALGNGEKHFQCVSNAMC